MKKEKKLYKIGYITELLNITPRTVRYYEQFGLLPHVKRTQGQMRLYDDNDIEIIKKVRYMQESEYLPLEVIKARLFGKKPSVKKDSVIVTDSSASISKELQEEFNIHVIPLTINLQNKLESDGQTITAGSFLEKSKKLMIRPSVVPPSEDDFIDLYLSLHKKGYSKIYSVHCNSNLLPIYQNAASAACKVADRIPVAVVDSKNIGAGLGVFVINIAEAIIKNNSAEEIKVLIDKQIPLIFNIISVNSLKYIITGGIIDSAAREQAHLLSKLFEFKPVMALRYGSGEVEIIECCKERISAIEKTGQIVEEEVINRKKYINRIGVVYNCLYAEALALTNALKTQYPNVPITLQEGSTALSIFFGSETLGIAIV